MASGYTGRILRLNLTKKSISIIDTGPYEEYGGMQAGSKHFRTETRQC